MGFYFIIVYDRIRERKSLENKIKETTLILLRGPPSQTLLAGLADRPIGLLPPSVRPHRSFY
jgi:hypothetical protein